jgi:hypothetical protein
MIAPPPVSILAWERLPRGWRVHFDKAFALTIAQRESGSCRAALFDGEQLIAHQRRTANRDTAVAWARREIRRALRRPTTMSAAC